MKIRAALLIAAIAATASLPGVASAATTIEEQRTAILDCKRQRSVGGAAWMQQRRYASGSNMAVQIVPYDQVSAIDANAINICAASKLGLAPVDGSVLSRKRTVVRSVRAPYGYRGTDCGRNPVILYKGDLYCQWANR